MDFGRLLSRAWDIIWEHKFLIVLGIIVAITGGGNGGGGGGGNTGSNYGETGDYGEGDFQDFDFGKDFNPEDFALPDIESLIPGAMATGVIVAICCGLMILVIAFFYINRVATGGLIAGVNQIETVGTSSFAEAWKVGWASGIRMFLIGLVGVIPFLVTMLLIVIFIFAMVGVNTQVEDMEAQVMGNVGLMITIGGMFCIGLLVQLVVGVIQTFADRACVIQEKGVIESYTDGWGVLRENLGPAVLLFLIQFGIRLGIGLVLLVPSLIFTLCCCCLAIPVLWVISGTIEAYFSTLWTLAWREWTQGPGEPMVIEQAPAV